MRARELYCHIYPAAPISSCAGRVVLRAVADRAKTAFGMFPGEQCGGGCREILARLAMADLKVMTTNFFAAVDPGSLIIGVAVIAILIFCLSLCVEEPPGVSGFLKPSPQPADDDDANAAEQTGERRIS
jgi:hypothetical protein